MTREKHQAVVDSLLRSIRVESSVFARPELRAPWGLELDNHGAAFHIVMEGRCYIAVTGSHVPLQLGEGDFVVIPRGGGHIVKDDPATKALSLSYVLENSQPASDGVFRLGGNGAITRLICGNVAFEPLTFEPLLKILPPVMLVKRRSERFAPWFQAALEHIHADLDEGRPGANVVVARFADILFIQAVQAYLEQDSDAHATGWPAALRDRHIGEALALLHLHPERAWDVAALARESGLSRSAFAARFSTLVGESPLRYHNRIKLAAIAARLRSSDDTVSTIAEAFGYDSPSGLNKGFKQQFGQTPGEYRRRFSRFSGA
jgi:AraC family transcriptional regulator, alkane utilization regulator